MDCQSTLQKDILMHYDNDNYLIERWKKSPWKEGIKVLIDPHCSKEQFASLIKSLYPNGDELVTVETFRGRGEFCDFRGVNLSGICLREVDFHRCDLSKSNFEKTDLIGADFSVARLHDASFSGISAVEKIRFGECFAEGAKFNNVQLVNADFSGADLVEADFSGALLERCDFGNARFQNAEFKGARMIDCNVLGARFSAKEQGADWYKASTFRRSENIIWVP